MKGTGSDSNFEFKFQLYLKRILRQMPNLGPFDSSGVKGDPKSGTDSAKFLVVNSTTGVGYDNSLTVLSMMAPSSTLSTNTTMESVPSDYLHSRSITAISRHSSLVAVLVIMSLFLIITISTTGLMLAFCKKKNTVFALQKCEQDSEYELDDMEQTDIEMCDDSEISPKMNKVRSRTCPSFNNVTDSDRSAESPSRQPLVRHGSWKKLNDANTKNILPRSFTINVLQNISNERLDLESIDDFSTSADGNLLVESRSSACVGVLVDVCASRDTCSSEARQQEMDQKDTNSLNLHTSDHNSTLLD